MKFEELKKTFTPVCIPTNFLSIESPYQTQGGAPAEIWYQGRAIALGVTQQQSNLYPVYMLRWELTEEYKKHWEDEECGQYWGEDMACDWDKAEILYQTGELYDPDSGEIM